MKTVLLAISSSIAFYKAYELISMYKKEGLKVKVLLSKKLLSFVSKLSFEALADDVLCEENESWLDSKNHISFSRDCDVVVLAPATVNSINKLAYGIADNLFIQTLIASKAPLIIAPAANPAMLDHFSTKKSLEILRQNGVVVIKPICKELACKEVGEGALADILDIFYATKRMLLKDEFFLDKTVLITGGGTREKIDEVRFIANSSSAKMAKSLADAFYFLGARVIFLSSIEFKLPYELKYFQSSKELKALMNQHKDVDFVVMAAAVSDFIPQEFHSKIKKSDVGTSFSLNLTVNEDLIKNFKTKAKKIAFKLESDAKEAKINALNALKDKNLDMLCLNILTRQNPCFNSEYNDISLFYKDKESLNLGFKTKQDLAFEIAKRCKFL